MPDWIWIQNVVFPIIGMGMGGFVLYGVYRTINKVLDRRHEAQLAGASRGGDGPELEEFRAQVEMLEDVTDRLQHLQERLDFAERMLTRQQRERIEPGGRG